MKNSPSLAGSVFNRLTLVEQMEKKHLWLCECSCGNETVKSVHDIARGFVKSCGCLHRETVIERNMANAIHGLSHTPTGVSWRMAIDRCYNPKTPCYVRYGAIGIRMCEYLRATPINLIELIGERPSGRSIDRENNSGSYTCGKCAECLQKGWPLNVRRATPTQQGRNQHRNHLVIISGKSRCVAEWAEIIGISESCLRLRIKRGWKDQQLLTPLRKPTDKRNVFA